MVTGVYNEVAESDVVGRTRPRIHTARGWVAFGYGLSVYDGGRA